MDRVFYFSGYRLTIFHWDKNECLDSFAFDPGEEGLDRFRTYLHATDKSPVKILVDLIEEDFVKQTIPHVGHFDRKAIVKRIVDRQYRRSRDYVHYRITGRETAGRKDDILLYNVLTNPAILDPWLDVIRETHTPVCGIWSLPVITPELYRHLNTQAENVLVVSQQVPSNLRQTYLHHGKLQNSRSAVVNLEEASIGEYIATEVEQTIHYLSNQRHIGFDEKIEIHVICRDQDLDQIRHHCNDSVLRHFIYHPLNEFSLRMGCSGLISDYCSSIYSCLCARHKSPVGHYGPSSLFSDYYRHLTSLTLYAASVILLLASIIISLGLFSDAGALDTQTQTLSTQTVAIQRSYQNELAHMEPRLANARMMQSTVLLNDKIQDSNLVSPQSFMSDISRILVSAEIKHTRLNRISWQQNQSQNFPGDSARGKRSSIDYASSQPLNHLATIGGQIITTDHSLKTAFAITRSIANTLEQHESIQKIRLIHMPVDTRPDASIEDEIETPASTRRPRDDRARFEIELIMKARQS